MLRGSITEDDRNFVEKWENIAPSQNAIIRLDTRGDEKHEVITGRKTFLLTTEERIITQDRVSDTANDPFVNGSFRPIEVPASITQETNPNALSDEEILSIFSSSEIAWSEWMNTIDSPATLRRMVDLADSAEDLTVKRLRQVEARYTEMHPRTRLTSKDPQLQNFLDGKGKPAGDDGSGAANPRRQGGRSSDYRS